MRVEVNEGRLRTMNLMSPMNSKKKVLRLHAEEEGGKGYTWAMGGQIVFAIVPRVRFNN